MRSARAEAGGERPVVQVESEENGQVQVPVRRTVLVIPLEEQEGNDTKKPPRLILVMPVEPRGSVSETNSSIVKDKANDAERPDQPLQLVSKNNSYGRRRRRRDLHEAVSFHRELRAERRR